MIMEDQIEEPNPWKMSIKMLRPAPGAAGAAGPGNHGSIGSSPASMLPVVARAVWGSVVRSPALRDGAALGPY